MSADTLPTDAPLRIAPGYRLQWEEAQGCNVLLFPEGMIKLNPSAGEILGLCDGSRSGVSVVAALQKKFPQADLEQDVRDFLSIAHERGWICPA